jgi:hypothetical protein
MRAHLPFSAFLVSALAAGTVAAAEPATPLDGAEPASVSGPSTKSAAVMLSAEEMETASGGQGVSVEVLTRQQLSGTTSGNTVNAGTLNSGNVSFGADALDGFSGVGNFVINTGANNTLQGAINISVVTTPAN